MLDTMASQMSLLYIRYTNTAVCPVIIVLVIASLQLTKSSNCNFNLKLIKVALEDNTYIHKSLILCRHFHCSAVQYLMFGVE